MISIAALATASSFFAHASAIITIGIYLAITFLLFDVNGALEEESLKLRRLAFWSALGWATFAFFHIITLLANILDSGITSALDSNVLKSFLTQVTLGKFWFFQLIVALLVAGISNIVRRTTPALFTMVLALAALVAPVFQSHSAASGSHTLAIGSLVLHVGALAFWIGGVVALLFISEARRAHAAARFSVLALWCAVVVVVSGTTNAYTRLNFEQAWSSSYARMVLAKVLLTLVLIYLGYRHRKNIVSLVVLDKKLLARLLFIESAIMAIVLASGSWLSNQQPPQKPGTITYDPAIEITGMATPAQPTVWRVFWAYEPDALMIGLLLIVGLLYFKGVRTLSAAGTKWPVGRTVAFVAGLVAIDFATSGGLGVYAKFSFSYHMMAHMVLGMIAPIGLILGAPITLALRTLPQGRGGHERGVRGTLVAIMHSRIFGVFANPLVALAIFDGSLFALYLTPLFGDLMANHVGHIAMNIHFILAGALFFHVIVGIDPNPKRIHYLARIVTLFAAMSIHAFFSVAVMSSTTLFDGGYYQSLQTPWITDLLADQRQGGAIGWGMGEIPILLALIATFIQWMRDDSKEAQRLERNSARKAAMGQPDELAQYNAYLASLAERENSTEWKKNDE